jgi:hypothetical protein
MAEQVQRVCHDTLPWLISFSLGLFGISSMKYRVYYPDQPGAKEIILEAPDHRAAAKQLFSQRPRNERCRIRVETKGSAQYSVQDFDAVEFMDELMRASLPPAPSAEAPRAAAPRPQEMRVVITDINMRFSSMIIFMVKWAFAAIPAVIIICIIVMIVIALGVGLLSHR